MREFTVVHLGQSRPAPGGRQLAGQAANLTFESACRLLKAEHSPIATGIITHPVNELILSQGVHQRVTGPHFKFHERQEFITLRYTYYWSEFEVEMLKEASCAELTVQTVRCAELAHENCYSFSQHPLWTS